MNELFTRAIDEKDVKWLAEFPPELMNEGEQEITDFIMSYTRSHGARPSLRRVMEKFEYFIPYKFDPSTWEAEAPPISDVFNQTIQRKLVTITERKLREMDMVIRRDGEVPLEVLDDIQRIHTMSLGVTRYSRFDRSLYFRRRALNLPFKLINSHIGGMGNGDFMLIAGRLGTGKSTVAQYIAKEAWLEGKKILFVSAEMLSLDVFSRIDAMVGKFNPLDLRSGETPGLTKILSDVYEKVRGEDGEIIIPRSRLLTPSQIATFAKNLGAELIVVDGAYLLQPSSGHYSSKWEKVATVSNELKQAALDLNLPMIATVQLKRGVSGDDGYDPEDIALSDALGQDADFVMALHPNKTVVGRFELQLIKNRYGSQCACMIFVNFDTMEITDETLSGAVDVKPLRTPVVSSEDWLEE